MKPAIGVARATVGGEAPAFTQNQNQVFHGADGEFVCQLDALGEGVVAVFVHKTHMARGEDFAGCMVPGDGVGPHRLVVAMQENIAAGGDGIGLVVIVNAVCGEIDSGLAGLGSWYRHWRGIGRQRYRQRDSQRGAAHRAKGKKGQEGLAQRPPVGEHDLPIAPPAPNCNPRDWDARR